MDPSEYAHMKAIYDYVYSTPPSSSEREQRLSEINKEDSEKLYDFDMGVMSGRIKKPTNKESEVIIMEVEKIKSYNDFKAAWGKVKFYRQLTELHQRSPELYETYKQRMEKEKPGGR